MNDPGNLTVALVFIGFGVAILVMYWWVGRKPKG